jgi:hypothetical protein
MIHVNVTAHPTAAWTLQQLHEAIASNHSYRFISFIIHDRDDLLYRIGCLCGAPGTCSHQNTGSDPQANSLCERLIGALRRECLDWIG